MTTRKRGALSTEEMDYIRDNRFDLTIEAMAEHLNRTPDPVRKFIDKENLQARDLSEYENRITEVREKYYYKELKKQLSTDELTFFEHQWVDYQNQFQDVVHSEEMQVYELIRTEVLINRGMEERRRLIIEIEDLEEMLNKEMSMSMELRDSETIRALNGRISALIGSKSTYITEHEKLLTKKEKIMRDLKSTRDQRHQKIEDSKNNFVALLKNAIDLEERKRMQWDMEVNRIAADKAQNKLADFHSYSDGRVDQPLLTSETLIEEEKGK